MRTVVQFEPDATGARLAAQCPDVEVIPFVPGAPPAGTTADCFFGGNVDWPDVLRWLEALEVPWVQLAGTGIDKVPPRVFEGRTVTCARGTSAGPIAEWVLAALLAQAKRMPESFVTRPPQRWNAPMLPLDAVEGTELGLVGLGGIGRRVASLALTFGMRVRALRRTASPTSIEGVQVVASIDDLLRSADHVVLAAPATAETRHVLDERAFGLMKPGTHVINIARGSLIDQNALRNALDAGVVSRATLDVTDPEPLPAGHWMYTDRRILLSPHASWSTRSDRAGTAIVDAFVTNLVRRASGMPLVDVVDPVVGY